MKPTITEMVKFLLVIFAFLLSTVHEAATLEYTIQKYSAGRYMGFDVADMDGDGTPEVLTGSWQGNHVEIWTYDQLADTLTLKDDIPGFLGNTISVRAADFDKDGDNDVVVGLRFAGLWYATNNGPGGWSLKLIDATYSWKVLVADFDQDGNLDIYDGADRPPYIRLFYGDGSGNFTNPGRYFPPTAVPRGFNVADINGDGIVDLIGTGGLYMRAFLNPGNRTVDWQSIGPTTPFAVPGTNELVTNLSPSAADLDGNGVIDQVAYLHNFTTNSREVIVFEGSVSNDVYSWTKRSVDTMIPATAAFGTAGVSDLNDDGYLDIHIGGGKSAAPQGVIAYLGDGAGNYSSEPIIDQALGEGLDHGVGSQESFVTVDINGDGTTDIVTNRMVNGQGDGFEVLLRIPSHLLVDIDIKPGSDPNCFNVNGHGVIPVAVLGSPELNVSHIKTDDTLSFNGLAVRVRGNKGPLCSMEDSNGDEFLDLVCHFEDDPSQWLEGTEETAILKGELVDGTPIEGTDSICIVP